MLPVQSLDALKSAAARDPKAAIQETAKQFEALFMQQLMKSMREATPTAGLMDNEGTKLGTEMLDSQLAVKMAGLPGGLTAAIARQLERQMGIEPSGSQRSPSVGPTGAKDLTKRQVDFVRELGPAARAAEQQSGIPAAFMIGQAAHETGWGRSAIRNADGSDSHNLFAIKATPGWTGATTSITTTEWSGGEAKKVVQTFRSYASKDDAFRDYARLLTQNPRYAEVAARAAQAPASAASAAGFAAGLQRAGYATDPAYASKLSSVINRTLQAQRVA